MVLVENSIYTNSSNMKFQKEHKRITLYQAAREMIHREIFSDFIGNSLRLLMQSSAINIFHVEIIEILSQIGDCTMIN
jgi:hypothetical protein